jgi:hypothetical protein
MGAKRPLTRYIQQKRSIKSMDAKQNRPGPLLLLRHKTCPLVSTTRHCWRRPAQNAGLPVTSNRRAGSPSSRDYGLEACPSTCTRLRSPLAMDTKLLRATKSVESSEFSEYRLPIAGFWSVPLLLVIVEARRFRIRSKIERLRGWFVFAESTMSLGGSREPL